MFCIDMENECAVLNSLRRELNQSILERAVDITDRQKETLKTWLESFEFYAVDERNRALLLEGTEWAKEYKHTLVQANRMAVFKTAPKETSRPTLKRRFYFYYFFFFAFDF